MQYWRPIKPFIFTKLDLTFHAIDWWLKGLASLLQLEFPRSVIVSDANDFGTVQSYDCVQLPA